MGREWAILLRDMALCFLARCRWLGLVVWVGLVLATGVQLATGQESIRMSFASSYAAEARREAAATLGYYNVKLGPTAWRFGAGLGVEGIGDVRVSRGDSFF